MTKRIFKVALVAVALVLALAVVVHLTTGEIMAQTTIKTAPAQKVAPKVNVKDIPKICTKADLAQWKDNLPLSPSSEFPFSTSCKACWEQLGVLNLPSMSVWITNKGQTDAPASKVKLSWESGKVPFQMKEMKVDVPPIKAGENYFLKITVPQGNFFQIAKPVTVELDCNKQVDECNENNNVLTYNY